MRPNKNTDSIYEIYENEITCLYPDSSNAAKSGRGKSIKKSFTFSGILTQIYNQSDVFKSVVEQRVKSFLSGKNATLFAFGASGSGKMLEF